MHIVGNWKMNQNLEQLDHFFKELSPVTENKQSHIWIAPQLIHIAKSLELVKNSSVQIGSQNCSYKTAGALTGETSPENLKEMGVTFTLIGHSERRAIFNEGHSEINAKIKTALEQNLKVILCVGETLKERENNQTEAIIKEQLSLALAEIADDQKDNIIIAYEPVWAIGTGKTASPQQAEDVHLFIRNLLSKELHFSKEKLVILYGGSVKPSNAKELFGQNNINGALIGGASLKASDFAQIIEISEKLHN